MTCAAMMNDRVRHSHPTESNPIHVQLWRRPWSNFPRLIDLGLGVFSASTPPKS